MNRSVSHSVLETLVSTDMSTDAVSGRPQRTKTIPNRLEQHTTAASIIDEFKLKLPAIGLCYCPTKKPAPEAEVVLHLQSKFSRGSLHMVPSSVVFTVLHENIETWKDAASTLFGDSNDVSHGLQFKVDQVTVTIYNTGTVMVQGSQCTTWLLQNYTSWKIAAQREPVQNDPDGSNGSIQVDVSQGSITILDSHNTKSRSPAAEDVQQQDPHYWAIPAPQKLVPDHSTSSAKLVSPPSLPEEDINSQRVQHLTTQDEFKSTEAPAQEEESDASAYQSALGSPASTPVSEKLNASSSPFKSSILQRFQNLKNVFSSRGKKISPKESTPIARPLEDRARPRLIEGMSAIIAPHFDDTNEASKMNSLSEKMPSPDKSPILEKSTVKNLMRKNEALLLENARLTRYTSELEATLIEETTFFGSRDDSPSRLNNPANDDAHLSEISRLFDNQTDGQSDVQSTSLQPSNQQSTINSPEANETWRQWLLQPKSQPMQPGQTDSSSSSLPSWTDGWLSSTAQQLSVERNSIPSAQCSPTLPPHQQSVNCTEGEEPWRRWLLQPASEPACPQMLTTSPTTLPSWTEGWLISPNHQTSTISNSSTPKPSPKRKKQKEPQTVPPGNAKVLYFSDSMGHKVKPSVENTTFIPSAHSGAKVVQSKGKTQPSLDLLKDAMQGDEAAVILQYGANDATTDVPISQFKLHYARLAKQASVNHAKVICCGILHRGDGKPANVASRNRRVDDLNVAIMEVCHEDGYTYFNNTSAIRSSANNPRLDILNRSRLHLNQNGKLDFARRLGVVTSKVLKSGTIPCPLPIVNCPISVRAIFFKLTYPPLEVNAYVIMHFSIEYCNTC